MIKKETLEGKPEFSKGIDTGIFVWISEGRWHVYINSNASEGATKTIGKVHSTEPIEDVVLRAWGANDVLTAERNSLFFESNVKGWYDGVIFSTGSSATVELDFLFKGTRRKDIVFLGEGKVNPEKIPFQVGEVEEIITPTEPAEPTPIEPPADLEVTIFDERIAIEECLVKLREGDARVFWMDGDNRVEVNLNRYAIIPREEYEAMYGGES